MPTLRLQHGTPSARALMRWCAQAVAILAVLPFTPPFSTCDLGALLAGRALHRDLAAPGSSRGPSIAQGAFFVGQSGDNNESLKDLAWAPAAQPDAVRIGASDPSLRLASSEHASLSLVSSPVLRI